MKGGGGEPQNSYESVISSEELNEQKATIFPRVLRERRLVAPKLLPGENFDPPIRRTRSSKGIRSRRKAAKTASAQALPLADSTPSTSITSSQFTVKKETSEENENNVGLCMKGRKAKRNDISRNILANRRNSCACCSDMKCCWNEQVEEFADSDLGKSKTMTDMCANENMQKERKKFEWTPEKRKQVGLFLTQRRVLAKIRRYGLDPETATPEQIAEKTRQMRRQDTRKKRKRDLEKQRAYRRLYMARMTPEQKARYLAVKRKSKARVAERKKAAALEEFEKRRKEFWRGENGEHDVLEVPSFSGTTSYSERLKKLSAEELEAFKEKERERHRRMRANYTPEQKAKRLEQNRRARMNAKARGLSEEQKERRRERNRRSYMRKMEKLGRYVVPRRSKREAQQARKETFCRLTTGTQNSELDFETFYSDDEEIRIVLDDDDDDVLNSSNMERQEQILIINGGNGVLQDEGKMPSFINF